MTSFENVDITGGQLNDVTADHPQDLNALSAHPFV